MADHLSVTTGAIHIATAGLHSLEPLFEDLERLSGTPVVIKRLQAEVWSVKRALESLRRVDEESWESLGPNVVQQIDLTVKSCSDASSWFQRKLREWARYSTGKDITKQDQVMITFKQMEIDIMSAKLRDCNLAVIAVIGSAKL